MYDILPKLIGAMTEGGFPSTHLSVKDYSLTYYINPSLDNEADAWIPNQPFHPQQSHAEGIYMLR